MNCPACGYAEEGGRCRNPVCERVNPAAAAHWKAVAERNAAERAERERLAAVRDRSWNYSRRAITEGERRVVLRRIDGLMDALRGLGDVARCAEQLRSSCERALGIRGRHYDKEASCR